MKGLLVLTCLLAPRAASACVCLQAEGVQHFLASGGNPTPIPANGVLSFREFSEGAFNDADYHLVNEAGEDLDIKVVTYPEHGGTTWYEIWMTDERAVGDVLFLQDSFGGSRRLDVVDEVDETAPSLRHAEFGPVQVRKDTSCGTWKSAQMELDFDADDGEVVTIRMEHRRSGEFWHGPASWTSLCGGLPPEDFGGRRDVWVVDQAGNASNVLTIGGPGGCQVAPAGHGLGLLAGIGLLIGQLRRR